MKTFAVAVLASATLALAVKPELLNSNYDVVAGEPFELKYKNCDEGCTITLETGPSKNLKPVTTLATDATGSSITVQIPSDIDSKNYAFRIVNNEDTANPNFSVQFPLEGSGAPVSSSAAVTSSAAETTSAASETPTSETETSVSTVVSTTVTSVVISTPVSSSETSSTITKSSTLVSSTTSTSTSTSASGTSTNIPDSAATGIQAQIGLVLAAAAAVAYL